VIENLGLSKQSVAEAFRFQCPLCHSSDTNLNPATNLARCFECRKNFNPIDMVMAARGVTFIDAVALLEPLLESIPKNEHSHPVSVLTLTPKAVAKNQREPFPTLVPLGAIIKTLPILEQKPTSTPPIIHMDRKSLLIRLQDLERQAHELSLQVTEIIRQLSTEIKN